jgi:hypothetical protein
MREIGRVGTTHFRGYLAHSRGWSDDAALGASGAGSAEKRTLMVPEVVDRGQRSEEIPPSGMIVNQ